MVDDAETRLAFKGHIVSSTRQSIGKRVYCPNAARWETPMQPLRCHLAGNRRLQWQTRISVHSCRTRILEARNSSEIRIRAPYSDHISPIAVPIRPQSGMNWPDNRTNQAHFRVFGGPITVLLYIYTKGCLCLGKGKVRQEKVRRGRER